MKKHIIAAVLFFNSLCPVNVYATGIPVVDVAHIAETVLQYQQQLRDYREYMIQTGLQESQMMQMLTDYQQVLREYGHYLNQIQGLQNQISASEWEMLIGTVEQFYGSADISVIPSMDYTSPTYQDDVRSVLNEYGLAPKSTDDVITKFESAGVTDTAAFQSNMEQANQTYSKYSNQLEMVASNRQQIAKLHGIRERNKSLLKSLGDESDLATLQQIASQQIMLSNQLEGQATMLNQLLQTYEPPSALYAAQKAKRLENEAARLEAAKDNKPELSGITNWADLGL